MSPEAKPEAGRRGRMGARLGGALAGVVDFLRLPLLLEPLVRAVTRATPLGAAELAAGKELLGEHALRWEKVRIARGGLLRFVFRLNGGRAFTLWHTINLPDSGAHSRANRSIVVHELVHVLQFERVGSAYIGQALHAQATTGYGYGGPEGLRRDRAAGKSYRDYNREQQAQIVQDCFSRRTRGEGVRDARPCASRARESCCRGDLLPHSIAARCERSGKRSGH
jgi:Domain of unknown function (DUF4157)